MITPIAILEQSRLSNTLECVTDYILVVNPFTGEYRNISKKEARELILSHKLKRYEIKHTSEADGTEILGAVWDTKYHSFKKAYGVAGYIAKLKNILGIKNKTGKALDEAKKEIREKSDLFRKQLHRAIYTMFGESYEEEEN